MEEEKMIFLNKNRIMKKRKGILKNAELDDIIQEYSLKQSNFNPSKQSPNVFIKKLEIRMKMYYRDLYKSYK
jgi:hypothetical protein